MNDAARPPAPPGTWRLLRLHGIDLLIRPSLLLMSAALVILFASRFGTTQGVDQYLLAAVFVFGLYVSVLLHEVAHVVVARAYGMPVPSVTLHLLGGETAIEGDSRAPGQEFWTAIVGPLTSLVVALAAWWTTGYMTAGSAETVMGAFAYVNALVGVLNLLPGLPLDGGRVFRAAIWAVSGSRSTGTTAAGWTGRALAVAALAVPLLLAAKYGTDRVLFDLVISVLVAAFLWAGASQALKSATWDRRIDNIRARDLVLLGTDVPPAAPPLPADLGGAELLSAMTAMPADYYRLVETDGSTLGLLDSRSVDEAYRKGTA